MKNLGVKLKAAWAILRGRAWAVVVIGDKHTLTMLDMTASESVDAIAALANAAEKLVDEAEDMAAGTEGENNVNAAQRIANGVSS
jgi:hypothetical protein